MQRLIPLLLFIIGASLVLFVPPTAQAHGVTIKHTLAQTISLTATYDSGEPMAGAQVIIYAPDDPTTPWDTSICDEAGRYQFVLDPTLVGIWEIQVRQAGHGKTIYVEAGDGATAPTRAASLLPDSSDLAYTPLQRVLMGGVMVWGCIGTALFFTRRRS